MREREPWQRRWWGGGRGVRSSCPGQPQWWRLRSRCSEMRLCRDPASEQWVVRGEEGRSTWCLLSPASYWPTFAGKATPCTSGLSPLPPQQGSGCRSMLYPGCFIWVQKWWGKQTLPVWLMVRVRWQWGRGGPGTHWTSSHQLLPSRLESGG